MKPFVKGKSTFCKLGLPLTATSSGMCRRKGTGTSMGSSHGQDLTRNPVVVEILAQLQELRPRHVLVHLPRL